MTGEPSSGRWPGGWSCWDGYGVAGNEKQLQHGVGNIRTGPRDVAYPFSLDLSKSQNHPVSSIGFFICKMKSLAIASVSLQILT